MAKATTGSLVFLTDRYRWSLQYTSHCLTDVMCVSVCVFVCIGPKGGKEALHLVVVGHVDAGKSTLMGRILHALGQVRWGDRESCANYDFTADPLSCTLFQVPLWDLSNTIMYVILHM